MTIAPMREDERPAVHGLLTSHKLPLAGFDAPHVHALVVRDGARVVGSAAIEVYGPYALLRSVAVDEPMRGRGLGQRLTAEALALARQHHVQTIFLLTETAAAFFPKYGFEAVAREDVPEAVRNSVEFTSACPASAVAMRRQL